MVRKFTAVVIAIILSCIPLISCAAVSGEGSDPLKYEEKEVQVYDKGLTEKTVPLRFYEKTPHVAYIGISDYFDLMLGGGLTVAESGDGKYLLTNASGATAEADVSKGIISSDDIASFENYYDKAREGAKSSFRDSDAPYLRLREMEYLDPPRRVEMDLGSCGFELYGDKDDVYFPLSMLTTWLTDIAQNTLCYNGKYLYVCTGETGFDQDTSYYYTEYYEKITNGEKRDSDLAAYSYADLCFAFRYMYGYPGTAALDTGILKEKGLDEALKAYGEEGLHSIEQLTSEDFREFWLGMHNFDKLYMDDGHTRTMISMDLGNPDSIDKQKYFLDYIWDQMENETMSGTEAKVFGAAGTIIELRPKTLTQENYYKCGDTAIICFNGFDEERDSWLRYYEEGGRLPEDALGIVVSGLRKASEDGGIRNIVFDLSANLGGYTDTLMAILSIATGREYLPGDNELSGQRFKVYFDVDRNLDGVFDEKDREVRYDFNYAALISNASFSCGNYFPFLLREDGGMLIGERSGGGCCSIQKAILSEGLDINISGCKFKLCDESGSNLEEGAVPDVPFEIGMKTDINEFTGEERQVKDYSAYADPDGICNKVSEWFSQRETQQ